LNYFKGSTLNKPTKKFVKYLSSELIWNANFCQKYYITVYIYTMFQHSLAHWTVWYSLLYIICFVFFNFTFMRLAVKNKNK